MCNSSPGPPAQPRAWPGFVSVLREALGPCTELPFAQASALNVVPVSNLHLQEGKVGLSHSFSKTRELVKRSSLELKPARTESESLVTHLSRVTLVSTSSAFFLLPIFPCTRIQEDVCPHDQHGIYASSKSLHGCNLTSEPGIRFPVLSPFGIIFGQEPLNSFLTQFKTHYFLGHLILSLASMMYLQSRQSPIALNLPETSHSRLTVSAPYVLKNSSAAPVSVKCLRCLPLSQGT